jgi:hypothetical protein
MVASRLSDSNSCTARTVRASRRVAPPRLPAGLPRCLCHGQTPRHRPQAPPYAWTPHSGAAEQSSGGTPPKPPCTTTDSPMCARLRQTI